MSRKSLGQYTFKPEPENKKYLEYIADKNRRSMAAEINILIEKARLEDQSYNDKP